MNKELFDIVTAEDIMKRDVIAIGPHDSLRDALQMMTEHHISGLPVLDKKDKCLGIITASDILFYEQDEAEELSSVGTRLVPYYDPETQKWHDIEVQGLLNELPEIDVKEVMSSNVISVKAKDSIKVVASLMRSHQVHRVIVLSEERKVLGIISAFDFVHLIADEQD